MQGFLLIVIKDDLIQAIMKIKKIKLHNYHPISMFELATTLIELLGEKGYSHDGGRISASEIYEIFDSNKEGTLTVKVVLEVIPVVQFESSEDCEEILQDLEEFISKQFSLCEVENY